MFGNEHSDESSHNQELKVNLNPDHRPLYSLRVIAKAPGWSHADSHWGSDS